MVPVTAVGLLVGLLLDLVTIALAVAVATAAAAAAWAWFRGDELVLSLTRAHPADPARHARLHNLVHGLCTAAGLPVPRLHVIDDPAPNAFAVGRDPKHAAVAVTTGLLDHLGRVELEGVLAHELSHVKGYDTRASTLAVPLVRILPFAPLAGRVLQVAAPAEREALADASGVALTRYPPGLLRALEKLRASDEVLRSAPRATAHLWIESPVARLVTRPPLEERIAALREL